MSSTENERQKLARLADAILEDVLSASDSDILAEVDAAYIKEGRLILLEAKANAAHKILADAKSQLNAWHSDRSRRQRNRNSTDAENTFQKFRREDPEFNQHMTMAARNGKSPTNKDKVGLDEDWADLQDIEGQGENE